MVGPIITPIPNNACPSANWLGGKVSIRMACEVAMSAPPPMPWIKRKATSSQMLVLCPQAMEASVNSTTEAAK